MARAAAAFVPGHVTVFFCPHWRDDPARTGSTGAGLTLSDGVTVRFEPAAATTVTLNGGATEVAPVERVLDALSASGRVDVDSPLPIGQGFGVSGAMTLGTALAANHVLDGTRTENELVSAAHVAEVQSNTGLGDVVAQARGGLPIRQQPGAPPHGQLDGIPATVGIEYVSYGPLSTPDVITGDLTALRSAGEQALTDLQNRPTVSTLFAAGRRFARDADLLTPRVESVVEDVVAVGGEATMGMLGETVVAIEPGLSEAGYEATACRTHPTGSSLRP